MQAILEKLKENMQVIYRRSVDADNSLAELQKSGKAKFQSIFPEDSCFQVKSKRFAPYVEELAKDIVLVEQKNTSDENVQRELALVVKKMELLFVTLANLQDSLK